MGGLDKGLLPIQNRTLVQLCIENIRPQTSNIIISANRNLPVYRQYADIVLPDTKADYAGPLSGILSVMDYLLQNRLVATGDLLTVPCDMPLLPADLAYRLHKRRSQNNNARLSADRIVVAHDGHRLQPLCALLPLSAKSRLEEFVNAGHRKVLDWIQYCDALTADFSGEAAKFVNINTPHDVMLLTDKPNNHV